MVLRHGGESQVDHLVGQRPIIFEVGKISLVADGDHDQSSAAREGDPVADAGAVAGANLESKVRNGKAPIVMRNRVSGSLDPVEQILARDVQWIIGQSDVDFSAGDAHDNVLRVGLRGLQWRKKKK